MKSTRALQALAALILGMMLAFPAAAHSDEDFEKAEMLIAGNAPCSELSDEQLELMGDYYMEQMHPGELHEIMDERMGGEGSETLRQVHISMAKSFYCGDSNAMGAGMMGMMMGRNGYGMMGYGKSYNGMMDSNGYGYGMMGGAGYGMMNNWNWWGAGSLNSLLFTALLLLLAAIAAVVLIRLLRQNGRGEGKRRK